MDPYCWGTVWALFIVLVVCQGQTEEDEKRPYKFAFAIEGYQHRSEEKDERGIIMGEFGFVTGDGVYHVTVYATDENGDFKILKMKNYYIGLPGEGTTPAPSKLPLPPARVDSPPSSIISTTKSPILQHLEGLMGCSSCIVPGKKKTAQSGGGDRGPPSSGEGVINVRLGVHQEPVRPGSSIGVTKKPFIKTSKPEYNEKQLRRQEERPFGAAGRPINAPGSGLPRDQQYTGRNKPEHVSNRFNAQPGPGVLNTGKGPQSSVQSRKPVSELRQPKPPSIPGSNRFGNAQSKQKESLPGILQTPGSKSSSGPVRSNAPETFASAEGLPPGMSMEDLMALLYKFNYTLRFHGHHESGYRNGEKEGGYFFNGRDGLGRNVKYVANEFGFQPNITLVDLGLQSPDTPNENNEGFNELRGNEFKWFYKH